jgi:predicted RNase H-like nuclease (RuvC/YqgF family)
MNAVNIVQLVHAGEIPRDSGLQLLSAAMGLTDEQAEKVMGSAGYSKCGLVNQNALLKEECRQHQSAVTRLVQNNDQLRLELLDRSSGMGMAGLLDERDRLKVNNERQCQKIKDLMDEKAAISSKFYQERFDMNAEIDKGRRKIGHLQLKLDEYAREVEGLVKRVRDANAQATASTVVINGKSYDLTPSVPF